MKTGWERWEDRIAEYRRNDPHGKAPKEMEISEEEWWTLKRELNDTFRVYLSLDGPCALNDVKVKIMWR